MSQMESKFVRSLFQSTLYHFKQHFYWSTRLMCAHNKTHFIIVHGFSASLMQKKSSVYLICNCIKLNSIKFIWHISKSYFTYAALMMAFLEKSPMMRKNLMVFDLFMNIQSGNSLYEASPRGICQFKIKTVLINFVKNN